MKENELEKVRERLNQMIIADDVCQEELLRLSQELDCLIVSSMRRSF